MAQFAAAESGVGEWGGVGRGLSRWASAEANGELEQGLGRANGEPAGAGRRAAEPQAGPGRLGGAGAGGGPAPGGSLSPSLRGRPSFILAPGVLLVRLAAQDLGFSSQDCPRHPLPRPSSTHSLFSLEVDLEWTSVRAPPWPVTARPVETPQATQEGPWAQLELPRTPVHPGKGGFPARG